MDHHLEDESDKSDESDDAAVEDDPGEVDRRHLVKLLIVIAIWVPLLGEGFTLVGLGGDHFEPGDGRTGPETESTTAIDDAVAEGDELLAETDRTDTLTTATLRENGEGRWVLTLTVAVKNTVEEPDELEVGTATAVDGREYHASAPTGRSNPASGKPSARNGRFPAGRCPTGCR